VNRLEQIQAEVAPSIRLTPSQ